MPALVLPLKPLDEENAALGEVDGISGFEDGRGVINADDVASLVVEAAADDELTNGIRCYNVEVMGIGVDFGV